MNGKAIIAGGGTGGHIYPALAIADALRKECPKLEIHFVGSPLGLESKIVPQAGYPLHLVSIGRLNKNVGLLERIKTLLLLPWAFLKSLILLLLHRPRFVLGVGGYASAPILFVAAFFGFKTFIWEPNAYPGLANRLLSRWVDESLVVFERAKSHLRTRKNTIVGMPIRKELELPDESIGHDQFHVLIFGGSQGARDINSTVVKALAQYGEWAQGVQIRHQTGRKDHGRIVKIYDEILRNNTAVQVDCREYLDKMQEHYQWADLVVCRGGTGTISELAATGKAAVIVPFPYAADDHQRKNAEVLVGKKAARMILNKEFTAEAFKAIVQEMKNNRQNLVEMSKNVKQFYIPNAAQKISHYVLSAVDKKIIGEINT